MLEPLRVKPDSTDLVRIKNLPVYEWWLDPSLPELIKRLTELYKTPQGKQHLRPGQAAALSAAFRHEGLLAPLQPGDGKTLISFLLPHVMALKGYSRPLLIVPAGVNAQTMRDYNNESEAKYRDHWRLPPIPIETYQVLSRKRGFEILAEHRPDHIIFDECQLASDSSGTVWSKLKYYMTQQPKRVPIMCLSASLGDRSPQSYWHFSINALGQGSPVPVDMWTMLSWHGAIADKIQDEDQRLDGTPLLQLWPEVAGEHMLEQAQHAYGRRFTSTSGVVASVGQRPQMDVVITVTKHEPDQVVIDTLAHIITKREVPALGDQQAYKLIEDIEIYQRREQLEVGFVYVWDPAPPEEWRAARKMWGTIVGDILAQRIPGLESPELIKDHLLATESPYAAYYHEWQRQRELYHQNTGHRDPPSKPIWVSRKPLQLALDWLERNPERGIVWVPNPHIGIELAEQTGIPYFRKGGVSHDGKHHIESWRASCFASMRSCSVGLNLQHWHKDNYHLGWDSKGERCEQLIGRTHRSGQQAAAVTCEIPWFTDVRAAAILQSVKDAKGETLRSRVPKKLSYCDWRGDARMLGLE